MLQLESLAVSRYERVVAAEALENGSGLLYIRNPDGQVSSKEIPFRPFLLLENSALLDGFQAPFELKPLSGASRYKFQVFFNNMDDYDLATKLLKDKTGLSLSSQGPFRVYSDMMQNFMMGSSFRLFRGMAFHELLRMQFDIETYWDTSFEFPNAARESDRIVIISMSDSSGWKKIISGAEISEKELLQEFVKTVRERDPDVLEGHNIFRFDLPYIEARAKMHKVKLALGRDGSNISKRTSRFNAAERTINYTRYDIYGRHVADTFHLLQFYDVTHRDLESYGLKSAARHFGVAAPDRTYVESGNIPYLWDNERETLLRYAGDDAYETGKLSEILSPSYFYQTQLIPLSYQNCIVRGNATKIDSLLVSAYLNRDASIPSPESGRSFAGAFTKAFGNGVFEKVWHCDIRSLYPSIILAEKWTPSRDFLGIFPEFLATLRKFRLEAKDAERKASTREQKDYFNSLQTSFKIIINSFYGYLGADQASFNDFEMAEKVTARGREILASMLDFLEKSGAVIIEGDTDGVYFKPPEKVSSPEEMRSSIQSVLPEGIEVELDGIYKAMYCYKSKNYALLSEDGEISISGAALKSRGLEPFQRNFIEEMISLILHGKASEIPKLYEKFKADIRDKRMPLADLAKTETLNDSLDSYSKKLASGGGRRSAAYELALASGKEFRQGDQVSFYVTGTKKKVSPCENSRLFSPEAEKQRDENVEYYLFKLEELYAKFSETVSESEDYSDFKLE